MQLQLMCSVLTSCEVGFHFQQVKELTLKDHEHFLIYNNSAKWEPKTLLI